MPVLESTNVSLRQTPALCRQLSALPGGSCVQGCPGGRRSPCEVNDDVSTSLLHLGEGQRGHLTPDFQSLLHGPSHFSFYKLPWEPDNSERQQTLAEERPAAGPWALLPWLQDRCHQGCHSAPVHLRPVQALLWGPLPRNVQQVNAISVESLWPVSPEGAFQEGFVFSWSDVL